MSPFLFYYLNYTINIIIIINLSAIIVLSNTLGAIFMNIRELQKLDFLLKCVNENSKSRDYKIVVCINNKFYKVDFVPEIVNLNSTNERSVSIRKSELKQMEKSNEYLNIGLEDLGPWYDIFKNRGVFTPSDISLLVSRSIEFEPYAYYESLIRLLDKLQFKFTKDLPLYVYNLKSLSDQEEISFFPIDLHTEFSYVSLEPVNAI